MNIQEIFDELDEMLSIDDKKRIIEMSKSDFSLTQHFGLGRWIRNNYIYSADSFGRECFEWCVAQSIVLV